MVATHAGGWPGRVDTPLAAPPPPADHLATDGASDSAPAHASARAGAHRGVGRCQREDRASRPDPARAGPLAAAPPASGETLREEPARRTVAPRYQIPSGPPKRPGCLR